MAPICPSNSNLEVNGARRSFLFASEVREPLGAEFDGRLASHLLKAESLYSGHGHNIHDCHRNGFKVFIKILQSIFPLCRYFTAANEKISA